MNEEKEKGKRYMIPQNISAKFEIIRGTGIGVKELIKICFGLIIGIALFLLISIPSELQDQTNIFGEVTGKAYAPTVPLIWRVLAVAIPIMIQVFRYSNIANNRTGGDIVKMVYKFYTENQHYKYKKGCKF